ncbi:MAG: hypothetical protein HY913_16220 [Desulfomonile tiedjei]|nr:hypothetical protein [Desulfomonile tiedjei]
MTKLLSISILTLTLLLAISMNVFSQETITDCERRCGIRTEMGGRVGPYQVIAECLDRCSREFWKKVDQKDKDLEEKR